MKKEIWKEIPGYEGLYSVSNIGRIKSHEKEWNTGIGIRRHGEIVLKQSVDKYGYNQIALHKNSISKNFKVHRLVAMAFYGESNLQINHKDGVKTNNFVENIEYCTASENQKHCNDIGLRKVGFGEESTYHKLTNNEVMQIKRLKGIRTAKIVGKYFNTHKSNIQAIWEGRTWKHIICESI